MATDGSKPCIRLPKLEPLKIRLPGGAEIQSLVDSSKGPPTDCTLVHSLMLQLTPVLANMACFLKVLKIFKLISSLTNPNPVAVASGIVEVAKEAASLISQCLVPMNFVCTIIDILKLIIAFLKCLIEAVRSVLTFQVGINFADAQGNPVLLATLECAQDNAQASMTTLQDALAAIQPLLQMVQPLLEIAAEAAPPGLQEVLEKVPETLGILTSLLSSGAAVGVPTVAEVDQIIQTLDDIKATLEQLQDTLESLG